MYIFMTGDPLHSFKKLFDQEMDTVGRRMKRRKREARKKEISESPPYTNGLAPDSLAGFPQDVFISTIHHVLGDTWHVAKALRLLIIEYLILEFTLVLYDLEDSLEGLVWMGVSVTPLKRHVALAYQLEVSNSNVPLFISDDNDEFNIFRAVEGPYEKANSALTQLMTDARCCEWSNMSIFGRVHVNDGTRFSIMSTHVMDSCTQFAKTIDCFVRHVSKLWLDYTLSDFRHAFPSTDIGFDFFQRGNRCCESDEIIV